MIDIEDAFANTGEVSIHGDEDVAKELIDFITSWVTGDGDLEDAPQTFAPADVVEVCVRCFLAGQIFQAGNHVMTLSLTEETVSSLVEDLIARRDA